MSDRMGRYHLTRYPTHTHVQNHGGSWAGGGEGREEGNRAGCC